jgi:hypothetical protein
MIISTYIIMTVHSMNIRCLSLLLPLLLVTAAAQGQDWEAQGGARLGATSGFDMKLIKDRSLAIETILGFRSSGVQVYFLAEKMKPIMTDRLENFYAYYGGGVHAGFVGWDSYYSSNSPYYHYYEHKYYGPAIGIDGIIGAEYCFQTVPVSMGINFKPFFEFYGPSVPRFNFWDFGVTFRYCFGK